MNMNSAANAAGARSRRAHIVDLVDAATRKVERDGRSMMLVRATLLVEILTELNAHRVSITDGDES